MPHTQGPPAPASAYAGSTRRLMREIRAVMAGEAGAQERLDQFVRIIAGNLVADVCSVYLRRTGGQLELCATEGLAKEAVHATRMRAGEGLVGQVAMTAGPLNLSDAPSHPSFSYHPETGEQGVTSFLGVPILRGGRLLGVLTLQNRTPRRYDEEEVETLQTAAMVLAEVVADPDLAGGQAFAGLELRPSRPERLIGRAVAGGLAIGVAVKHEPHVPPARMIADNPEEEAARVEAAAARLRESVDALLEGRADRLGDQPREVLEAYRMFAHDQVWLERLLEAARSGLTAEAAVERVRNEQRARIMKARDPYMRDRLHDLEDLANRLLRHLAEDDGGGYQPPPLPKDAILFARALGPADLLEYDVESLAGLGWEAGGATSHAAIVARALGLPVVGRLDGVLDKVEEGDEVILDGEQGEVHLRPSADVLETYNAKIALDGERRAAFKLLRDQPAVTLDGRRLHLMLNAGLRMDLAQLDRSGADGIGLFRTEFQFMVSENLPRQREQIALFKEAFAAAGDRPITFRTLDLGGDKILSYVDQEREENPAMGWRALRLALERPGLMRYQLRALIRAAAGRDLRVMFPLVATVEEFRAARAMVADELEWAAKRDRPRPAAIAVGAMIETPAILFSLDALLKEADFLSVGANDLMQFLFAADRGHARLAERYDFLSPAMLSALKRVRAACAEADKPVSVCGEVAGRPLEALALIALGFDRLSMPASGVGPVKRMALTLDAEDAARRLEPLLASDKPSVRAEIEALADDVGASL